MKTKFNTLWLVLLLPSLLGGQQPLTEVQIREDFEVLKNVLVKGHPALYEYTSRSEWDSLFANFAAEKVRTLKTDRDLYRALIQLTDRVRDGHLIVMRPRLDSIPPLFPLLLKIIHGHCYTDTDDFGIPVGSEILTIDGIEWTTLRERLLPYAPSDGFNTSKKDRQMEREFGILHFYEFGAQAGYRVSYRSPSNRIEERYIDSQSFESIGKRFAQRNSNFGRTTLGKQAPDCYFIDSLRTAVLTLNTFNGEVEKFQSALGAIFKDIRRKKAKHLIIDIRQNEGGYPLNAIHAFSYLASKPFKQRRSSEVSTATLPEEDHGQNLVNGYTYETFFKTFYESAEKQGERWLLQEDTNEARMVPNKKRYGGKVYVLIGGKTFSAGASFALFCKNAGIPLIGEETGGGYYTQTGGYPILYTLPHSAIKILVSLVKINRFVEDTSPERGRGILPDQAVPLTVADLIAGKDSQLDYVLKQIKNQ
ncbi:MAG: S41 family peptidase [Bacteroidota bacterium]